MSIFFSYTDRTKNQIKIFPQATSVNELSNGRLAFKYDFN